MNTSTRRIFVAAFSREEDLLSAVRDAKASGFDVVDAYAPYAVHGLPEAMGVRPSRLPWACFGFGLAGLAAGVWLQVWTSSVDWPLNVGGKPFASLPAFVPVAFEIVVLLAGLGTFFAFLAAQRAKPSRGPAPVVPRVLDDRFALVLRAGDARFDAEALDRRFRDRHGATFTEERLVEEAS
jgi:hypothetical protein